jgi:SAM-dependent methyltransferase
VVATRRCIVCDHAGLFPTIWSPNGYSGAIVRCPRCGLAFQDPQPSEVELERSYYHDPEFSRLLMGPLREFTLRRAREKLALLGPTGAVRPGARLLDVGSSSGAWLEVAHAEGMAATGVELGETTGRAALDRGLDVRVGTLGDCFPDGSGERFDLITFWDVLEHLRDPRLELLAAARLLAPGGLVAATFPNLDGWYPRTTYRLLGRHLGVWEYPELPVHLYDFDPRTARRLLERCGFAVQAMRTFPVPFSFYRSTSLSRGALGGGPRALVLRAVFEALRLAVYPVARAFDRQNSLFVTASLHRTLTASAQAMPMPLRDRADADGNP